MELQSLPVTAPARILIERIEFFVQSRTGGLVHDLSVEVEDEQVVLTGRVNTWYHKQLATHAVLDNVDGVHLVNDIEVA